MGSSYSKINGKLSRSLPKTIQLGITPNSHSSSPLTPPKNPQSSSVQVEEHRGRYDNDKDLLLLANLRQLGQINVEAPTALRKTKEQILDMYEIRALSEQQAALSRPTPNCLSASVLANLLDNRKLMNNRNEVKNLVVGYNFDYALLEKLALSVTTPNIGEGTVARTKNLETGEERITMTAAWSEPSLKY